MEWNDMECLQREEEAGKIHHRPEEAGKMHHRPAGGYEVLVVDDDPEVLGVVSLALEIFGYRVTQALNGLKALEILRTKRFDLMVTDLKMDGMDGITLLKKSKDLYPFTKVILMTGFYDPALLMEAVQNQADDYVLKPFSLEELHVKTAHCLENEISQLSN